MRTTCFIDGLNLYHSLDNLPSRHQYKWLDLKKLSTSFLESRDTLTEVIYFTALPTWNRNKLNNHQAYICALIECGVTIVKGFFNKTTRHCPKCHKSYNTFEEKKTDVNIAISMLEYALLKKCDKIILISGDSDLIPPLERIQTLAPRIKIRTIVPGCGNQMLRNFQGTKIRKKHLMENLLPKTILRSNQTTIQCPKSEWLPT